MRLFEPPREVVTRMMGEPGTEGGGRRSDDEEMGRLLEDSAVRAWFKEHLPELRRSAEGNRLLYQSLTIAFVLGLAAHVGGYALSASSPGEPLGLIADLLYGLGFSLWTGVVVVLFVQVFPEVKRRQFKQAVDAYEATRGDHGQPSTKDDPTS
jgi:hypothetical protein